jgi:hypothetical protein
MGDGQGNITSRGNPASAPPSGGGGFMGGGDSGGSESAPPRSDTFHRNQQAAAMYAAQDNAQFGTPISANLQAYLPGGAMFDPSRGGRFDAQFQPVTNALSRTFAPVAGFLDEQLGPRARAVTSALSPGVQQFTDFMTARGLPPGPGQPAGAGRYDPTGRNAYIPVAPGTPGLSDPESEPIEGTGQQPSGLFGPSATEAASSGLTEDVSEIERRNRERSQVPEFKDGGRVGPGGVAFRPDGTVDTPLNTQGMGLPPALQALLGTGDMPGPGLPQMQPTPMYSYQMGGQVGPGGMPMPVAGQQPGLMEPGMQGQQLPPEAAQQHIQQFVQQNPEQVQQIQALIQQGLQTGEITQQQLTLATQMATVVADNPEMYPQFVETMVQQGLFDPGDLPPQFDPGLIYSLMIAGQSMTGQAQGAGVQEPMLSMEQGGPLPQSSSNPDGSIPINAHEGEYVIPAEVVRAKGTDFFDKMIQSYRDKGADQ